MVIVELCKIVDNDGNGQSHHQDPRNSTAGSNELPQSGGGVDVPVAHRGHRDDRPPEGRGDGSKAGVLLVFLREVAERGEDEDPHGEEQHQQAQLLVAVLQSEGYRLKPSGVPVDSIK